ncbi:MAG: hypothetical protein QOD42_2839 [Sphingomonadales bacterium]|nr:hypothetical protein [Sphingomonadales bacterium]
MKRIRIGCSGWNYRHWRAIFYPPGLPQRQWFAHYAAQFDTVEINNSFYRLPAAETFAKWRDQAPPGFCYAVKANRFLTQAKKLKDCEQPLARMMAPFRALQPRLGPILYQLPPRFRMNLERLERFLQLAPTDVTNVFEFRDESWYVPEIFALLDRHGASLCLHDMAGSAIERIAVGPVAYVRFHGAGGKYRGRYPEETLLSWAGWMDEQALGGRPVWGYFNNDIHADAVHDAQALKTMVEQMGR